MTTSAAQENAPAIIDLPLGLEPSSPIAKYLNTSVPLDDAVELHEQIEGAITLMRDELATMLRDESLLKAVIRARLERDNATVYYGGDFRVKIQAGKTTTGKRIDVLRKLYDLKRPDGKPIIPPAVLAEAVYEFTPPSEPVWKVDLRKTRALKDYGLEVQAILKAGLPEEPGRSEVVIERIERNVTPIEGAA